MIFRTKAQPLSRQELREELQPLREDSAQIVARLDGMDRLLGVLLDRAKREGWGDLPLSVLTNASFCAVNGSPRPILKENR